MKQIIKPTPIEPFHDPSQRVQTYNAFTKDKYPNYYFQNESFYSLKKGQYFIGNNQLPQTMTIRKGAKPFKMSKAFKISEFWSDKQHNIILKKTGLKTVGRFIQTNQEEQRKQFVQGLQLELQSNLDNMSIDEAFNGGISTQRDMPSRPFRFNSQISIGQKFTENTPDTHRTRVCSHTTLEQLRNKFKKLHDIGRQAMLVRPKGIITRI